MNPGENKGSIDILLKMLRLPSILSQHREVIGQGEREGWDFTTFLHHILMVEAEGRRVRRLESLLKRSCLPKDKTLDRFDLNRMPVKIRRIVPELCKGHFVDKGENILAFGLPGRGKTHLLCAIGHELVKREISVFFTSAQKLVSRLLRAKRDYALDLEIRKLDAFEAVICDDIGYVKQDRDEMDVLFTLLSDRHERKSVMISSNLVFSQWSQIFKDPLTTAAAIDKLVHYSTILEIPSEIPSFRMEEAKKRHNATEIGGSPLSDG
jgi:DNA replication protein DnaC